MSTFDTDGYCRPPSSYDANNRRGRLHRDKFPGLWWRVRANGEVVWEWKAPNKRNASGDGSVTLEARSEREAIREWKIRSGRLAEGTTFVPKGNARLEDAWVLYEREMKDWIAEGTFSDKTYDKYENNWRLHIAPTFRRSFVARIERDDIIDLYKNLRDEAGLASWTRVGVHRVLKHVLDKAVAERWIPVSPLSFVDAKHLPKQEEAEDYEPRLFRNHELVRLFDACADIYRLQVIVLAFTGLRIRELCGLQWQDVDLLNGELHVRRQLHYIKATKTWTTTRPKGKRTAKKTLSRRTIRLRPQALAALAAQKDVEEAKGFGADSDFVFTTSLYHGAASGLPVSPHNFGRRGVGDAARKAGLGHARPHDLRHTTASILAQAGVRKEVAAKMMGHTTEVYEETYAKAFDDAIERAETAELLDAIRFGVEELAS